MKDLKEIVKGVSILHLVGELQGSVESITFDSRAVVSGGMFIAIKGTQVDGHNYMDKAIDQGAKYVICEAFPEILQKGVVYIQVTNSAKSLGIIAANFYDNPSKKLKLVGVTGTNGKTTIATLLYRLHEAAGYKSGLISTIQNHIHDKIIETKHTTPDVIVINKLLNEMVEAGCEYCFMEVSSHAVVQNRVANLIYAGGIFTNLTHDHLDYHKTFKEYLEAKKGFFDMLPSDAFAVVNKDDKNGMVMLQNTKASRHTYSLKSMSDFKCKIVEVHFDGTLLEINGKEMWTHLVGEFNAYNILAIYSAACLLGMDEEKVLTLASTLREVDGRFECIRSNDGVLAIVDYAHTPDALKNVLETISRLRKGTEQVITVVGAGGDRDKTKRPVMARVSVENSDKVILTSDNPRTEDPGIIIEDMAKGVEPQHARNVLTITDRTQAIKTACMMAKKGDIILVAGKGHETYQEVNGVRSHFDDREVIREQFALVDIIDKTIKN